MLAFLFLSFYTLVAYATDAPATKTHTTYFSLSDQHGFPLTEEKTNFDCEDKIYTVVTLNTYPKGRHDLSVRWKDPSGETRETTNYPFYIRENETRLWAWLSLRRATGASLLQWINPAAGLEEFVGPWTVDVHIDNKKIDSKQFEVLC